MQRCILVAESSDELRDSLSASLRADGYRVETAGTAAGVSGAWARAIPDLVLLDASLPDDALWRALERWRAEDWTGELIVLGEVADGVAAVAVRRPVVVQELLALIRHRLGADGPVALKLVHCEVDLEHQVVTSVDGSTVRLTTREAEFLRYLGSNPGRPARPSAACARLGLEVTGSGGEECSSTVACFVVFRVQIPVGEVRVTRPPGRPDRCPAALSA